MVRGLWVLARGTDSTDFARRWFAAVGLAVPDSSTSDPVPARSAVLPGAD
jgi:hypothetical protein